VAEFPAPITVEVWTAFAAERKHWEIVEAGPTPAAPAHFIATDRKRYLHGDALMDPMTTEFTAETCVSRESAAYFIGLKCVEAALLSASILHADA
jgi:hypothetical protein